MMLNCRQVSNWGFFFMWRSCVIQMYRHWKNWVWAYWVVWKRWQRNSSTGRKLRRPTSNCSETLPCRSGFTLRTWSTSTIRKQWKVLTRTLTPIRQFKHNYLLPCYKCKCFMLAHTGYTYLCPPEGTLSSYGLQSLLTLSCGSCSVSEGQCSIL